MKTIAIKENEQQSDVYKQVSQVLKDGGLVCLPCNGSYRIVADLSSEAAIMKLFQSKHRTQNTPTLIFVANKKMLEKVAPPLDAVSQKLTDMFWPGPMTLLVDPAINLPAKVVKRMTRANGKVGVRIPQNDLLRSVLREFGGPLLVSSANRERKKGAYSTAQVRKNFLNSVDLFLDAGDLAESPASTVVDIQDGEVKVVREGAVPSNDIMAAATL
jgi:L-threonylcarbamoyladenylate synthase